MTPDPLFLTSDILADLHERYRALKGVRPTPDIARDMDVTTSTLLRYDRDGIAGLRTMGRVAAWVKAQEQALRHNLKEHINAQRGY